MTRRRIPARVVSLLSIFIVWQLTYSLASPQLLPSPFDVVQRIQTDWLSGELALHFLATLQRLVISFSLAMVVGVPLGLFMAHRPGANAFLDMPLTILLNIPALVVIILAFVWLGLNELAAITAVVVNKMPTIAVTLREGGRAIDHRLLEINRAFGLSRRRGFVRVYLPQLYPYLLAATRSGLALVWKIILVVELMGCSSGMGFQLGIFFQYFDIAGILAYSLVFVTLILIVDSFIIRPWETRVMRWRQLSKPVTP